MATTATIIGSGIGDLLRGSAANEHLLGLAGNDTLQGLGGDDILRGDAGNDTLDGGAGLDAANYVTAPGGVTVDLAAGTSGGAAGHDRLIGIEEVFGSPFADTLWGGAGNDTLKGLGGGDAIDGRAGRDVVDGDTGDDTLWGGAGNDVVLGDEGRDTLSGGEGDDLLQGGTGNDTIDGGAGNDTVSYADASAGVTVNLPYFAPISSEIVPARASGGAGDDAIANVENVRGSRFDDDITGGDDGNRLAGGSGDDSLQGLLGDDTLEGGAGRDAFVFVNEGEDFFGGAGPGISARGLDLITDFQRGADTIVYEHRNDGLADGGGFAVLGQALFDFLDSNDNNVLDDCDRFVEVKNVTHDGTTKLSTVLDYNAVISEDVFGHGGSGDLLTVFGVTGLTASDFSPGYHYVEGFFDQDDTLTGSAGDDTLIGFSGNDVLEGRAGNDTLDGGDGDDTLDGGAGLDTASYADADAGVAVHLVTQRATGGAGSDRLLGIENIVGSRFADVLEGTDGANVILGGDGDDDIFGDTDTGQGISGRGGGDTLDGGAGDDRLLGLGGDDVLLGGAGNDSLLGENGNDILTGGVGRDVFEFANIGQDLFPFLDPLLSRGDDVITDFARGQDRIAYRYFVDETDGTVLADVDSADLFRFLDSNHDNVLDNADAFVDVTNVTFGGVTRLSTVFDYNAVANHGAASGDLLTVFGVTGLTASDFV